MERRGVAHGDEQTLRAQQPSGDLTPGLRAGIVDKPIGLRRKLGSCGSCGSDVSDLELDARLWHGDVGGPFGGTETGVGRLRKGPQPEVLYSFELVGKM